MTLIPRLSDPAAPRRADGIDACLCILYLAGIYFGLSLSLPGGVPLPGVVAGVAGLLLAFKHAPRVPQSHAVAGVAILVIAALSILSAQDFSLLPERFKGFIQFSYSLVIAYAFFLAVRNFSRDWLARLFLVLAAALLAGSVLEVIWPAFKQASDLFRSAVFETGLYESDIRDLRLYGRVRPKLFTSEPSYLTFNYTLFAFCWYALSRLRGKVLVYLGLLTAGYIVMRGPTLMLGVVLVPIYEVLLGARRNSGDGRRLDSSYALIAAGLAGFVALAGLVVGWEAFAQRIEAIIAGQDLSFFARIIAPAILAFETLQEHPLAGVGLTGWEALDARVEQLYATTKFLSIDMRFEGAAHALTNYFWMMWIFLGLFWGSAMVLAVTWLLRVLGAPSLLFCWCVWIAFGQAAGGFVAPRTWAVMMLAAAIAIIHERARHTHTAPMPARSGRARREIFPQQRYPPLEVR